MTEPVLVMILGFVLLGVGWYGLMVTHHVLRLIVMLQFMSKAVLMLIAAGGSASGQIALAQSLIVTVIAADTMILVTGLALAIQIYRRTGTLDTRQLARLKG